MDLPVVLFLCTGNSARSQIAEALLRHYAADRFDAHSAGLDPKGINPLTVQVMGEIGVSLDGHSSKSIKDYLGKSSARYVITVCDHAEQACPSVWPFGATRLHWPFEDPAAFDGTADDTLDLFRRVWDQISARILTWLEEVPMESEHTGA